MTDSLRGNGQGARAAIHRIVSPGHICPFGEAAIALLQHEGFQIDDHWLRSRPETEAYVAEQGVQATPQIFIDGERIGGFAELKARLASASDGSAPLRS